MLATSGAVLAVSGCATKGAIHGLGGVEDVGKPDVPRDSQRSDVVADVNPHDTGSSDTGSSDTGSSDTGSSDTGSSDTGASIDSGPGNDVGCQGVCDCVAGEIKCQDQCIVGQRHAYQRQLVAQSYGAIRFGQSFAVKDNGWLTAFSFWQRGGGSANVQLSVYKGEAMSGLALTTQAFSTAAEENKVFFSQPVPVSAGQMYSVIIEAPTPGIGYYFSNKMNYGDGKLFNGVSWSEISDLTFAVDLASCP